MFWLFSLPVFRLQFCVPLVCPMHPWSYGYVFAMFVWVFSLIVGLQYMYEMKAVCANCADSTVMLLESYLLLAFDYALITCVWHNSLPSDSLWVYGSYRGWAQVFILNDVGKALSLVGDITFMQHDVHMIFLFQQKPLKLPPKLLKMSTRSKR